MKNKLAQPLEWNDSNISNLWDYYADKHEDSYFSKQVGEQILNLTKLTNKQIKVLDFGCGKGYMGEYILNRKLPWEYHGVDFSETSVNETQNRLKTISSDNDKSQISHIKNTPISFYEEGKFDLIFLLEVIEHLNDEKLESTLAECHRLLKKTGVLFITTPNDETLTDNFIYCPCCNQYFHKWQHERTWTEKSLADYLISKNFKKENSFTLNLGKTQSHTIIKTMIKNILNKKQNNLIFIAKK